MTHSRGFLRSRRLRAKRKASQQCVRCKQPVVKRVICVRCTTALNAARKARWQADAKAGVCVLCRRMPARACSVLCDFCAADNRARIAAYRSPRRRAA